ncbi:hypothetical protein QJQ45_004922 [Haematococcus lacustris]|nr:hypothetical protein QJQ45_004922 [Haematococcus lacustris]
MNLWSMHYHAHAETATQTPARAISNTTESRYAMETTEAVCLMLGFCTDFGLANAKQALMKETGIDDSVAVLAEHVSLLRVLNDWRAAFARKYSGTPRIVVQPCATQQQGSAELVSPNELGEGRAQPREPGTNQQQGSHLMRAAAGQRTSSCAGPLTSQSQDVATPSCPSTALTAPSSGLGSGTALARRGLPPAACSPEYESDGPPPLAPHAGPLSRQHAGPPSTRGGTARASMDPPHTKLRGTDEAVDQALFCETVLDAAAGSLEVTDLFDFKRPARLHSHGRKSAILQLDARQHDAMYALANCHDVNFMISNVRKDVRAVMADVFGVDKDSFTVWYKNRSRKQPLSAQQQQQQQQQQQPAQQFFHSPPYQPPPFHHPYQPFPRLEAQQQQQQQQHYQLVEEAGRSPAAGRRVDRERSPSPSEQQAGKRPRYPSPSGASDAQSQE